MAFTDRLHNRGSISTGYDIDNSCKFEADNSEYLYKTPSSAGNRKTWTFSAWVKRSEITATSNSSGNQNMVFSAGDTYLQFDGNQIWINHRSGGSGNLFIGTNRLFRDASAWYHIVWQLDTTDSTAADRAKLWVNGVRETSFVNSTYTNMSQNYMAAINNTVEHEVGKYSLHETTYASRFNGYMAEIHLVDGTALTPTSFGEFDEDSGIWKAKEYTGSYGTNGFYLDFSDSANLGDDASGNGNNFTETNITAADQATDTPTNNFCTLNVLQNYDPIVFTEGATNASTASGGNIKYHAEANMGFSSGKWYMEFYVASSSASDDAMFGFGRPGLHSGKGQNSPGNDTYSFGAHNVSRWYYNNQTWTNTGASGWDKGQVIQIAIDADNGKAWQGVNGTYSSGNPSTGSGGFDWGSLLTNVSVGDLLIPYTRTMYTGPGLTAYNFGGYTALAMTSIVSDENGYGSFEYAPPTGFYALCTKNLAEYG